MKTSMGFHCGTGQETTPTHTHKRLKVQAHNMLLLTVATRAAQCIISALQDL